MEDSAAVGQWPFEKPLKAEFAAVPRTNVCSVEVSNAPNHKQYKRGIRNVVWKASGTAKAPDVET